MSMGRGRGGGSRGGNRLLPLATKNGRINPSWTSKTPDVHCPFVTLWDLRQASPTASSFLRVDIGGFDTWIEVEIRPQSLTPPTLTVCTQAPLPLSILTGQADGGFSLVHSNDSALPQEQTKGTWETGCLERPGLGTRALFQPSAGRGGKYSVAFLPLRSGSGQMEGDGT